MILQNLFKAIFSILILTGTLIVKGQDYEILYVNGDNFEKHLTSTLPSSWMTWNFNNSSLNLVFPGKINTATTLAGYSVKGGIRIKASGGGTATYTITLKKNGTAIGSTSVAITTDGLFKNITYELMPTETITSSDAVDLVFNSPASNGQSRSLETYVYGSSTYFRICFPIMPPTPTAPALSQPTNTSVDIPLNSALTWLPVSKATSYRVQLSSSSTFETLLIDDSTITTTTKSIVLPTPNTNYYWRVNAKNIAGTSDWSEIWSFTSVPAIPDVPVLSTPLNGAINQDLSLSLIWNTSNGANSYKLQVSTVSDFSSTIVDQSGITSPSYLIGSLANDLQYYWRTSATNAGGTSAWSDTWNFTTIPAIPDIPMLSMPMDGSTDQPVSLTLSWNSANRAESYTLQISTVSDFNSIVLNKSELTSISYSPSDLNGGIKYYWRVNATNAGGTSDWSGAWNFTTVVAIPDIPVLSSPLNGSLNQALSLTLNWDIANRAESYALQVSTASDFSSTILDESGITATDKEVGGLINNTIYYWRVNATNAGGTSDWSGAWNFTTVVAIPDIPALSSPLNGSLNQALTLTLNWDIANRAESYALQVSTASDFSSTILDESGIIATDKEVSGLINNTIYYWRVNATNAGGTSGWSGAWNFTTVVAIPDIPVLTDPPNGSLNQALSLTLNWDIANRAESYALQVSTASDFSSTILDESGITATDKEVGGLINNTIYYWRVNASNAGGTSGWTGAWNFATVVATPDIPALSSPLNGSLNQALTLTLNWDAANRAESYALQVSTASDFSSTILDESGITTTEKEVGGLINNTIYYWRVNASNAGGTSDWSGEWNFTTIILDAINELNTETGVRIYPNPAVNVLYFDGIENEVTTISILSMESKRMEQITESGIIQLNISYLKNGIYLIKVENSNGIFTKKIIKR